jgi:alkylation response protein AidB-like acyl-CoA dehydrogenase
MRFLLETEHADLASSIDAMLTRADVPKIARALVDGDPQPATDLWSRLADTGVTALLADEESGGMGAGAVEMVVAVERLGRHCVPGPVAESTAVVPWLLSTAGRGDLLEPLLSGQPATIAHEVLARRAADAGLCSTVLALTGSRLSVATVRDTHRSVDPTRTVSDVEPGETVADDVDAHRAGDLGVLATAAQLLGLASGMLALATDHARSRTQFGRPVGSFQAVKHHLADVAIAVEMARPLVHGAALAVDGDGPADAVPTDVSRDVSAAAVACGRAADLAARTGLQTLGAIGYTREHDLSLYLTKTRALLTAWGTPSHHRRRVLEAITR